MLNSSISRACALLLATAGVLCAAAVSHAGLFDLFKAKPRPVANASTSSAATRRGQSPVAEPAWQQPAGSAASTPWYSDPYQQSGTSYGYGEYCCGPEDKSATYTKSFRRKCDQTYYPPIPPYCFPCYGHHPTCWRRMQECSVCPREPLPPPPAPRAPKRTPPKVETTPAPPMPAEPPEPMDDPSAMRFRSKAARVTTTRSQPAAAPATAPAATRSRWTSYTDALPDDKEDEIPEPPADTLEEMIEAEDEAQLEAPTDEGDVVAEGTIVDDEAEVAEDQTESVDQ